jgi:hypothetical protein
MRYQILKINHENGRYENMFFGELEDITLFIRKFDLFKRADYLNFINFTASLFGSDHFSLEINNIENMRLNPFWYRPIFSLTFNKQECISSGVNDLNRYIEEFPVIGGASVLDEIEKLRNLRFNYIRILANKCEELSNEEVEIFTALSDKSQGR